MPEQTPELPASSTEASSEGGSFLDKLKIHKFKILAGTLGIFILVGAVFGAYKFGQRQVQPALQPAPGGQKVFCQEPRPEVCTMECIQNPPYICGSDGKSHCSTCQACSNPKVEWYVFQSTPCQTQ